MIHIALALVALILGVVILAQTKLNALHGWAIVAIALCLLLMHGVGI